MTEANADVNQTYGYYGCALKSLIISWRRNFNCDSSCFFGVVMLAAYTNDATFPPDGIAPLRDTQLAALDLNYTAVISATDLGEVMQCYVGDPGLQQPSH
jgi:hypothetical protein